MSYIESTCSEQLLYGPTSIKPQPVHIEGTKVQFCVCSLCLVFLGQWFILKFCLISNTFLLVFFRAIGQSGNDLIGIEFEPSLLMKLPPSARRSQCNQFLILGNDHTTSLAQGIPSACGSTLNRVSVHKQYRKSAVMSSTW